MKILISSTNPDEPSLNKLKQIKEQIERMGAITRKLMKVTKDETKEYLQSKITDLDKSAP